MGEELESISNAAQVNLSLSLSHTHTSTFRPVAYSRNMLYLSLRESPLEVEDACASQNKQCSCHSYMGYGTWKLAAT